MRELSSETYHTSDDVLLGVVYKHAASGAVGTCIKHQRVGPDTPAMEAWSPYLELITLETADGTTRTYLLTELLEIESGMLS